MARKVGVHLANDGNIDFSQVRGFSLVKGLVRLDLDYEPTDYKRLAEHIDGDCEVVLRLFWPGKADPNEFVKRTREKLPPIFEVLNQPCWIEIGNEPNHRSGIEGWGRSEVKAEDFKVWYFQVFAGLLRHFGNLGFPGLAVGEWAHGERTWARVCADAIQGSDWCGIHAYWQTERDFTDPRLGRNWRWYKERFPGKTLIVTEAGNSSCDNPSLPQMTPERQVQEYTRFAQEADVYGVTFFILGGSDDWAGFRLFPETLEALRGL